MDTLTCKCHHHVIQGQEEQQQFRQVRICACQQALRTCELTTNSSFPNVSVVQWVMHTQWPGGPHIAHKLIAQLATRCTSSHTQCQHCLCVTPNVNHTHAHWHSGATKAAAQRQNSCSKGSLSHRATNSQGESGRYASGSTSESAKQASSCHVLADVRAQRECKP